MGFKVCDRVPRSPQLTYSIVALCNHLSRSLVRKVRLMQEDGLVSTLSAKSWQVKSPTWAPRAASASSSSIEILRGARTWPTLGPRCPRPAGLHFLALLSAVQHLLGDSRFPSMSQKLVVQQNSVSSGNPGLILVRSFARGLLAGLAKEEALGLVLGHVGWIVLRERTSSPPAAGLQPEDRTALCFSAVAKVTTKKTCPAERRHPVVS